MPCYLQPTLVGARSLPDTGRSASVIAVRFCCSAEYWWRINEFVTGALFYDTGAVAPRLGDMDCSS